MGLVRRRLPTPQTRHRRLRPLLRHPPHPREHSCLRCPLLRADPAAKERLEEIRDNLIARIAEADPTAGTARPKASRSASPARTPNWPRWTRSAPAAPKPSNSASPASPTPPDAPPTTKTLKSVLTQQNTNSTNQDRLVRRRCGRCIFSRRDRPFIAPSRAISSLRTGLNT